MSIQSRVKPVPEGKRGFSVRPRLNTWKLRLGSKLDSTHEPFIAAELYSIQGLLGGLSSSPIDGWLEFKLVSKPSTFETDGDLDVYNHDASILIGQVINKISRILQGVAAQYPDTQFSIKMAYTIKWQE